ncbi:MAG TPA: putative porin, partial [Lutibacter sp.]|nr:putative porin [Lutibacter sp.]
MKKLFTVLFFGFYLMTVDAQIMRQQEGGGVFKSDSTTFKNEVQIKLSGETKYTDYKIISINNDTTLVDTTLTIAKDYKFNYIRKDNFELLPFANQGQTYNKLGYNFNDNSLFPTIGATAKHYNYYQVEDVYYYDVPTPTSEFMYRTGMEQGQVLDGFLTMNTSRQFNFSIAYKGLRSLGKYRNSLASHGNFRTSVNYQSKNKFYSLKAHYMSFDLLNNENGGLTEA